MEKKTGNTFQFPNRLSPRIEVESTIPADGLHSPLNSIVERLLPGVEFSKLGRLRPGMLLDQMDEGIISVNTGIDIIQSIPSVQELADSLL